MVSFTCEHCQDVVKKPKIPNHYNRCSGAWNNPYWTCIDYIHRDEQDESVKKHTSCITEVEKFEKKPVKAKQQDPKPEKGEKRKRKEDGGKKKKQKKDDLPITDVLSCVISAAQVREKPVTLKTAIKKSKPRGGLTKERMKEVAESKEFKEIISNSFRLVYSFPKGLIGSDDSVDLSSVILELSKEKT